VFAAAIIFYILGFAVFGAWSKGTPQFRGARRDGAIE
jgi:hypothetical protein